MPNLRPLRSSLAALLLAVLAGPACAQGCIVTSVGKTPLDDPAGGSYAGYPLGLWYAGSNAPTPAHQSAGLAAAASVVPLDASGAPSPTGRVVLLSIGMSNTTLEFSTWKPISDADPARSTAVTVVDGAQGGMDAIDVADATSSFWSTVATRLATAGVTAQQVQAVWLKSAVAGPTAGFPLHAQQLRDYLAQIARNLKVFYPNVKLCFLSSRIYAGYAISPLNPEPFAYESGFAVRWLIEQQDSGDPTLAPSVAPWLGWGPYMWADGLVPRTSDGLTWACGDYLPADLTHPIASGQAKVAAMLDNFFRTDPFSTPWYLQPATTVAAVSQTGIGCGGSFGTPVLVFSGVPFLGNQNFRCGIMNAAQNRFCMLAVSAAGAFAPVAGSCNLLVDPNQILLQPVLVTNAQGRAIAALPVPSTQALIGLQVHMQWGVDDPQGAPWLFLGGLAMTRKGIATLGI